VAKDKLLKEFLDGMITKRKLVRFSCQMCTMVQQFIEGVSVLQQISKVQEELTVLEKDVNVVEVLIVRQFHPLGQHFKSQSISESTQLSIQPNSSRCHYLSCKSSKRLLLYLQHDQSMSC